MLCHGQPLAALGDLILCSDKNTYRLCNEISSFLLVLLLLLDKVLFSIQYYNLVRIATAVSQKNTHPHFWLNFLYTVTVYLNEPPLVSDIGNLRISVGMHSNGQEIVIVSLVILLMIDHAHGHSFTTLQYCLSV